MCVNVGTGTDWSPGNALGEALRKFQGTSAKSNKIGKQGLIQPYGDFIPRVVRYWRVWAAFGLGFNSGKKGGLWYAKTEATQIPSLPVSGITQAGATWASAVTQRKAQNG